MPSLHRADEWPADAALTASALAPSAFAQDNTLRIVVGYPPGGSSDRMARIVGEKLQSRLGMPVVVENRPGAGGRLAAQQIRAGNLGQNVLMVANPAVMVVAPQVFKDNGYDAEKDFVPVSHVNDYEFGLAVATAVPVRELNHLLAWLRANPSQANVGVPATGSLPHFFALMTGEKAGVNTQVIGYKGSAPLITDLLGGQIPVAVDTFDTLLPHVQTGKLRILAVVESARSASAPNIPTAAESGVPGFSVPDTWVGLLGPAGMPAALVQRLGAEMDKVMRDPEVVARMNQAGYDIKFAGPADFSRQLADSAQLYKNLTQQAGITPE